MATVTHIHLLTSRGFTVRAWFISAPSPRKTVVSYFLADLLQEGFAFAAALLAPRPFAGASTWSYAFYDLRQLLHLLCDLRDLTAALI